MGHPLHKKVGEALKADPPTGCEVVLGKDCGTKQELPLYVDDPKPDPDAKRYCQVDILILKENRVRGIIEIEESGFEPIKIFGKFFASAFSTFYHNESHGHVRIPMGDCTFFLQVMDSSDFEDGSKREQFRNAKRSILSVIALLGSRITTYKLIAVAGADDSGQIEKLVQWVEKRVSAPPR